MRKDLLPIQTIAQKLNLTDDLIEPLGPHGAKLRLNLLGHPAYPRRGKMILVTATTPTKSGEGKTVTAIGLTQGLERIGKRVIITSREPSLGPVFGMKGGAAGGGRSQIEPSQKINLHFHGDFHAITAAHNLLAALIDSHLFHGNDLDLDPTRITFPRALDMNDRALRNIQVSTGGKRDGANRATGFLITAASEIMAILALAQSRADLRARLGAIIIGMTRSGAPVRAAQLDAVGGMMALLSDAILPNLVQTTEGTPALVHCGPFANIAHGTSSVISQYMGLQLADYVVNECGFASDLGCEKYMDIVMPSSGIRPSAAVLVTTVQSLRSQGEDQSMEKGFANLRKHIAILQGFGLPTIVAINRFPQNSPEDLARLREYCLEQGANCVFSEAFAKGAEGAVALAEEVVRTIEANPDVTPHGVYDPADSPQEKVHQVATKVYGASDVSFSAQASEKLARFTEWGYGGLPVCIAKTQYSLSDDPQLLGAPTGWTLRITDVALSAGAGFLVAISGSMMLMPGLPKESRASGIDVDEDGEIQGL
ncbi:MAG: formate--tetrahydrofolate ligase [Bryobacteraceae bacterium]|nr:formate--tetrahydrofolate ligase [Bryobacteraceae bacterium]